MPSLGNLFVTIGAKTEGLDKGSEASRKKLDQLRGSMNTTIKTGALLAASAAAAGATLITSLVNSGRLAIDNQAKLAIALNGTIGGVRALEMAAGDAGVEYGELSSQLVKFNSRIGEAQRGSGAAYEALNRLGLSADYLSSLDVDKRMEVIADRVRDLGLSSTQAAAEMRDLGIRNENLVTMMRQGGDAIREQAGEVRALGLNLSMVDAQQVIAANNAIGDLGDILTGVKDQLAVASAPYLTVIAEKIRQAAVDSGGFKDEIEAVINTIIRGFGKAGDVIQGLRVVFKGVEVVARGFAAATMTALELVTQGIHKLIGDSISGTRELGNAIKFIPGAAGAVGSALAAIPDFSFDSISDSAEGLRQGLILAQGELQQLAMQELPSSKIEAFLADVAKKSRENAEQIVAERAAILSQGEFDPQGFNLEGDAFGEVGGQSAMIDAHRSEQEQMLESLKNRYITEEELERQHREVMAVIGEEYDASRFASEEQWASVREQAQSDHWARLQEIANGGYQGIQALAHKAWGKVGAETAGAFQSILGTMAQGSRKAFEISKAWAIADALISTFQGIAAGVKLGWPMAIPAVAWAAATGFAQVSAIQSQGFNGGGGGSRSVSSAPPASAPQQQAGGGGGGTGGGAVIALTGIDPNSWYDGRQIIAAVNQAQESGARLMIPGMTT
jgi:hypothetical protein